jgi:hypothetical protein
VFEPVRGTRRVRRGPAGSSGAGGRGDRGVDLHPELREKGAASGGAGWRCRNEVRWPAGSGAVAKAVTDIKMLISRTLDAVGRTEDTVLTAFTDGCPCRGAFSPTPASPRRHFSTGSTSERDFST